MSKSIEEQDRDLADKIVKLIYVTEKIDSFDQLCAELLPMMGDLFEPIYAYKKSGQLVAWCFLYLILYRSSGADDFDDFKKTLLSDADVLKDTGISELIHELRELDANLKAQALAGYHHQH